MAIWVRVLWPCVCTSEDGSLSYCFCSSQCQRYQYRNSPVFGRFRRTLKAVGMRKARRFIIHPSFRNQSPQYREDVLDSHAGKAVINGILGLLRCSGSTEILYRAALCVARLAHQCNAARFHLAQKQVINILLPIITRYRKTVEVINLCGWG